MSKPDRREPQPSGEHALPADSAMLIMDLINNFDFSGGEALMAQTRQILPSVLALRDRYDAAKQPVIYANDNFGRWRSEFSEVVACCSHPDATGSAIARKMTPLPIHYSILKPRHSAFFMTPLKLLLDELHMQALTIVGIAGDQCVLATAMEAHTRGYSLWVPGNTMASITPARNQRAKDYLHEVLGARIADAEVQCPA
ncbi:MAG TPA: isochorismatase family cysteine hydrolase [Rhodanobacteraceae bacterium]|nr:isochorismatase family cysteine hydrolase [Rhodanobacteraceae bacterium]